MSSRCRRTRPHWTTLLLGLLLLQSLTSPLSASPLEEGLQAFQAKAYTRAHNLWLPLAKQGDAKAQYNLGLLYENGWGAEQHMPTAIALYKAAGKQGNADAQYNLGVIYAEGKSVFRNRAEAARWWRMAADQHHPDAEFNLGVLHFYGMGVKQDSDKAVELWERAASSGNADARRTLIQVYRSGERGIKKHPRRADYWASRSN